MGINLGIQNVGVLTSNQEAGFYNTRDTNISYQDGGVFDAGTKRAIVAIVGGDTRSGANQFNAFWLGFSFRNRRTGEVFDFPLQEVATLDSTRWALVFDANQFTVGLYESRASFWTTENPTDESERVKDTGWKPIGFEVTGNIPKPPVVIGTRHTFVFDMWSAWAGQAPVTLIDGLGGVLNEVNKVLPTGYTLEDVYIEGDKLTIHIDEIGTPAIPIAAIAAAVVVALIVFGVVVISYQYFKNEILAKEENIAIAETTETIAELCANGSLSEEECKNLTDAVKQQGENIEQRQRENGFALGSFTGLLGLGIVAAIAIALIPMFKK